MTSVQVEWTTVAMVAVGILFVGPFAAFIVACGIDVAWWSFTGHELFPWIGHALNGNGKRS